jgi:S1-C subfamily serine protease
MSTLQDLSNETTALVASRSDRLVHLEAEGYRLGSGMLLNPNQIVTAAHTVEGISEARITLSGGANHDATLVGWDPTSDLALLSLDSPGPEPSGGLAEELPQLGQLVVTIAFPSTDGIESALGTIRCAPGIGTSVEEAIQARRLPYFQTDTVRFRGFAGGAVFSTGGDILGLNTFGYGPTAPIVIPAQAARQIAERLSESGTASRGYLGIRSQRVALDSAAAESAGTVTTRAVTGNEALLVVEVEEGSPAAQGGIRVGDILLAVGDHSVESHRDLMAALWNHPAGTTVTLAILRGERATEASVTLGEKPQAWHGRGSHGGPRSGGGASTGGPRSGGDARSDSGPASRGRDGGGSG